MTEKRNHLHLVSDDTEYKDYALSVLDDAIYDAIISDADEYDCLLYTSPSPRD